MKKIFIAVFCTMSYSGPAIAMVAKLDDATEDLLSAAYFGDVTEAEAAFDAGANLNAQDLKGKTPLFVACERGNEVLASWLLQKGASPFPVTETGDTALTVACQSCPSSLIDQMLSSAATHYPTGAKLLANTLNKQGEGCLIRTCRAKNIDVNKLAAVIASGANANRSTPRGMTPLKEACKPRTDKTAQQQAIRLLAECGTDISEDAKNLARASGFLFDITNQVVESKSAQGREILRDIEKVAAAAKKNASEFFCTICQDEPEHSDTGAIPSGFTATPCNHHFHADCLSGWAGAGHHDCPLCRTQLKR